METKTRLKAKLVAFANTGGFEQGTAIIEALENSPNNGWVKKGTRVVLHNNGSYRTIETEPVDGTMGYLEFRTDRRIGDWFFVGVK